MSLGSCIKHAFRFSSLWGGWDGARGMSEWSLVTYHDYCNYTLGRDKLQEARTNLLARFALTIIKESTEIKIDLGARLFVPARENRLHCLADNPAFDVKESRNETKRKLVRTRVIAAERR